MNKHFEHFIEQGNRFLNEVALTAGYPKNQELAYSLTRAVFHELRDRIQVEESMHLVSQLPMLLKAIYVDGWDTTRPRKTYDTAEEFLLAIVARVDAMRPELIFEPAEMVKAVFTVLQAQVSDGEMVQVLGQLPLDIQAFILF